MAQELCSEKRCEEPAESVVRTKQKQQRVGAGPVTTVIWFLDDASEVDRRLGDLLCKDHRNELLTSLSRAL